MTDLALACSSELRLRIAVADSSATLLRAGVLAQVTQAVTSTLDAEEAVARLARLVVPSLADWCTVHVADEAGRVHRAAAQHRDPAAADRLERFAQAQALVLDPAAPTRVALRAEEAVLLDREPDGPAGALARGLDGDDVAALCEELGCASALVVPLRARDGAVGVLTLGRGQRTARRSARTRSTTRSTSGAGPGSPCTTPPCTGGSGTTPSRCSGAC